MSARQASQGERGLSASEAWRPSEREQRHCQCKFISEHSVEPRSEDGVALHLSDLFWQVLLITCICKHTAFLSH